MRKTNSIFLLLISAFIVFSCDSLFGDKTKSYKISVSSSPVEGGSVSPTTGTYKEGEIVTLTATPSNGWKFVRWEGDWSSIQNPSQLSLLKNYSIVGVFEKRDYPLNITIIGQGQVEEKVIPSKTYPYQTVVELTPVAAPGWRFNGWSGDLNGNSVPGMLIVNNTKNVTATFIVPIFLSDNGITIRCPNGKVGEIGIVNGVEYEVVDRTLLIQRRDQGRDLTKVCTSLVTDMSNLFRDRSFNQAIGNWDVSNVSLMESMFMNNKTFNQPIGSWDVSLVKMVRSMFNGTNFNQDIGNWDVGNVTDFSNMFRWSQFNKPIGNWDVSSAESMDGMFNSSPFNQNISKWCVLNIKSEPLIFSSSLLSQNKPIWGTCPSN